MTSWCLPRPPLKPLSRVLILPLQPFGRWLVYLSFGALLIGRVHEDAAIGDGPVNIGDHGAHIARSVGGAAILQERKRERGSIIIIIIISEFLTL